jgi:hypothetical protein
MNSMQDKLGSENCTVLKPTQRNTKRKLCVAIAAGAMCIAAVHAKFALADTAANQQNQTHEKGISEMHDELEKRGKQLRIEIESTCSKMSEDRTLKPQNNISDVVAKYIPLGISIKEAKAILRAANLKVHTVDDKIILGSDKLPSAWFATVELYIQITPKTPGNFDGEVGAVEALITSTTL